MMKVTLACTIVLMASVLTSPLKAEMKAAPEIRAKVEPASTSGRLDSLKERIRRAKRTMTQAKTAAAENFKKPEKPSSKSKDGDHQTSKTNKSDRQSPAHVDENGSKKLPFLATKSRQKELSHPTKPGAN